MAVEKITIPDFGDVQEITVVEIFISAGDTVAKEDSLIALESEKAVMDIPSPFAGVIEEVLVKEDDQVRSGDLIALIKTDSAESQTEPAADEVMQEPSRKSEASVEPVVEVEPEGIDNGGIPAHATPSIRALARKLGVDLNQVSGSGPNGRILEDDLKRGVLQPASKEVTRATTTSPTLTPDKVLEEYSAFGEIEVVELGRIQKISGPRLHDSWISIPHVTHFDEADITEMERFRKELNSHRDDGSPSFSPLVFVIRALAATLKEFPALNSSLLQNSSQLVLKKYIHLGIAVDTPGGLVVPVLKNADQLGLKEIATELARLSSGARAGKLAIPDIQGATFTISSLGGIGGTGFTPIVNSPQVGILGLSRSYQKPVWNGERFIPRLTLPFSVSYDHRVIDGAEAARFCRGLALNIEDLKRTLL